MGLFSRSAEKARPKEWSSRYRTSMLRLRKAELLQLRARELVTEAGKAAKQLDGDRLAEIEAEMDDIMAQLRAMHREQLQEDVERYSTP